MGCSDAFKTYKSVKFVRVNNRTLACTYYALMLLVIIYVIGFSIIINKGYQKVDFPIGTTNAKVKGTGVAAPQNGGPLYEGKVWNADDLVLPAQVDSCFITTKYVVTEQNAARCAGNSDTTQCKQDSDCTMDVLDWAGNGIYTGTCLTDSGTCELAGWCPLEDDHKNITLVDNVEKWTVFFKVNIEFPYWGVDKTNAQQRDGTKPVEGYNLFTLQEIVEMSGSNWTHARETGAILLFTTKFNCDLDKAEKDQCDPEFEVSRIDNVEGTISPGFNYRNVDYNGDFKSRTLMKRWGIQIIFTLSGQAGKFNILQTLLTIGAGVGFFSIATLVTDFVLESWVQKKDKYAGAKYSDIESEAENILRSGASDAQRQLGTHLIHSTIEEERHPAKRESASSIH